MHATAEDEFCEETFREILFRLFNRFFQKDLPISICVPILLTRFEDEEYSIKEGVRIRKLTDSKLLSSYSIGGYSDTYELSLVSSATHILEFQNYSVENASVLSPFAWDYVDAYPVEMIDKWFAAYRIVTLHDSGYTGTQRMCNVFTAVFLPALCSYMDGCAASVSSSHWPVWL